MKRILLCFQALLLVMMIALIASVGFAQASEPTTPYFVWSIPTDIQVTAGIAAVGILAVVIVISIGALCSITLYNKLEGMSPLSIRHGRHFRVASSWRTPLIKPI